MSEKILEEKFLLKKEVAKILRISEPTVTRLCLKGDIPSVKIGRSRRIPASFIYDNN